MNNYLIETELGYTNHTNGKYDTLNDDAKLNAYIGFPAGNRYPIERIPSEKQIALDELFGVE